MVSYTSEVAQHHSLVSVWTLHLLNWHTLKKRSYLTIYYTSTPPVKHCNKTSSTNTLYKFCISCSVNSYKQIKDDTH